MKIVPILALLMLSPLLLPDTASAQQIDTARSSIYLELSTGIVTNSLAVNYEYQFAPNVSFRFGFGSAHQMEGANATGGSVGVQYYTSGEERLDGGIGISLLNGKTSAHLPAEWKLAPAVNIGYRYQPITGGMMYRVGLSYSYNYGVPFQGSAGYAF